MRLAENPHFAITGASSGLGAALAEEIANRGHPLTLLGRDTGRLEAVAARCRAKGASVACLPCDVRDAQVLAAALTSRDKQLPIDVIVANAALGGAAVLAPDQGEPPGLANDVVEVNVLGVINTVQALQPRFVARGHGRFVLISSMAAYEGLGEAPSYAGSKAFVRVYGHGLRRNFAPHGIGVTVVVPGFIATPMSSSLKFRPPFLWDAQRAAKVILSGISAGQSEIRFPWQMSLGVRLAALMPATAADWVMNYERRHRRLKS